jgi:hypothetical protein
MSENIADLICEKKKLSRTSIPEIKSKIESNIRLVTLKTTHLPDEVVNRMNEYYDKSNSVRNTII